MLPGRERTPPARRRVVIALASVLTAMVAVPAALAHVERASYWPNPAGEIVEGRGTGGGVPKTRGLFSALDKKKPGDTRVVCQETSMKRLKKSLRKAIKNGWRLRPSEPRKKVDGEEAQELIEFNRLLFRHCRYDSIQDAVLRSGNNDRVVVMPGLYTEPESRAAPTNDPRCDQFEIDNDEGSPRALSYEYQLKCPNDQNLIYIPGRALGNGQDPQPPLLERRGIPNLGPCIRCNLQLEGSGVRPDDVIIDSGRVESGNAGPLGSVKDVAVFADRADGFVLRNMSIRHPQEHAIYVLEVDGYRLERFRTPYNGEYGVLTFVSDHGLIQKCDAYGSGDAAIYPGASPDTQEQVVGPDTGRYNTELRYCDMHHSALGFSGTDANAVWVHHNDFYDNANGYSTDVFTASGHPGFPQDSNLVEHNQFYSNNFNVYEPTSDIEPTVPVPVGTGMWMAGGNNNIVRNNQFWNNWRRGVMLFAVPDQFACDDPMDQVPGCNPGQYATSYRNQIYGNVMGRTPKTKKKKSVRDPNGEDFWWDEGGINPATNNSGNCWFKNTGSAGNAASITSVPTGLPADCANSVARGNGDPPQITELFGCLTDLSYDGACVWFTTPPEPK
jgi:hypothetical protein